MDVKSTGYVTDIVTLLPGKVPSYSSRIANLAAGYEITFCNGQ